MNTGAQVDVAGLLVARSGKFPLRPAGGHGFKIDFHENLGVLTNELDSAIQHRQLERIQALWPVYYGYCGDDGQWARIMNTRIFSLHLLTHHLDANEAAPYMRRCVQYLREITGYAYDSVGTWSGNRKVALPILQLVRGFWPEWLHWDIAEPQMGVPFTLAALKQLSEQIITIWKDAFELELERTSSVKETFTEDEFYFGPLEMPLSGGSRVLLLKEGVTALALLAAGRSVIGVARDWLGKVTGYVIWARGSTITSHPRLNRHTPGGYGFAHYLVLTAEDFAAAQKVIDEYNTRLYQ